MKSDKAAEFAAWQQRIGEAAAASPGFIRQSVLPPAPPAQVDWVILQGFESTEAATNWLHSELRLELLSRAQPMLLGQDDVHIVTDGAAGVLPAPVSAVISTRIKPGCEDRYRAWEQRIANRRKHRVFKAIASSRRRPACKPTGLRSCASTARPISKRG